MNALAHAVEKKVFAVTGRLAATAEEDVKKNNANIFDLKKIK